MTNDEDDTPPMSSNENLSSLVRQIALPFSPGASMTTAECSSDDGKRPTTCVNAASRDESKSNNKRKHDDKDSNELQVKKTRSSISPPLPIVEDSHQCNIITVLSAESLCDLQLDEDEGFGHEESQPTRSKLTSRNLDQTLKFAKVPQAAK